MSSSRWPGWMWPLCIASDIARGDGVHVRKILNARYGRGRWRKLKGKAVIEYSNGEVWLAEIHWFEAHGIGQHDHKSVRDFGANPMSYVKCVKNDPYLQPPGQEMQEEPLLALTVGRVYKTLPDATADQHGMVRVIDESYGEPGSEEGYLYPADYFQPFLPNGNTQRTASMTIHLDEYTKGVLHAEAVAANKSVSTLVRDWLDERLDLPVPA